MKELYKGLGHIAIYTVDMEESIAFYEKIGGSVYKRDAVPTPEGEKKLALVEFGGFLLELIERLRASLFRQGKAASRILRSMWTIWTRLRRQLRKPASSRL